MRTYSNNEVGGIYKKPKKTPLIEDTAMMDIVGDVLGAIGLFVFIGVIAVSLGTIVTI